MKIAKQIAWLFTIVFITALAGTVRADELSVRQPRQDEIGKIANCPVLKTKFDVSKDTPVIDYKGKSYYFCCTGCIEDFRKNPEKYTTNEELNVRQPRQDEIGKTTNCPVLKTKFDVSKDTPVIDYKGKSYHFCCPGCVEDFRKDPEKYSK